MYHGPFRRGARALALMLCACLLLSLLPAQAAGEKDLSEKFPDPCFLKIVYSHINKQPGDPIYQSDLDKIVRLYVQDEPTRDLTGLEYLRNVQHLTLMCGINEVDVNCLPHLKALYCYGCNLHKLEIRGLKELDLVQCGGNELTKLTLDAPALTTLMCHENHLSELDLSGCPALEYLNCEDNQLEYLDASPCPKLRTLSCSNNYFRDASAVIWAGAQFSSEGKGDESDNILFFPQKDENKYPRLDAASREAIRKEYYAAYKDPEFSLGDVLVDEYYGEYHSARVVLMDVEGMEKTEDVLYLNVGGFTFRFPSGSDRNLFLLQSDGTLIRVSDACSKGLLTVQDVYSLFRRFYQDQPLPFEDVDRNAWYYDPVQYAYFGQIFKGISPTQFWPNGAMARGMLVAVLWRQNGAPLLGKNTFTDVEAKRYYTNAVAWAAEKEIVNGVGGGRFAPLDPVTREQLVTILYRMYGDGAQAPEIDKTVYPDAGNVSAWAKDAMAWAVKEDILRGIVHDGKVYLEPRGNVTRAQVATLLLRIALWEPEN